MSNIETTMGPHGLPMTTKTSGIVSIHDKEYETVASRIQKFRKGHEDWGLITEIIQINERCVIMKASIFNENEKCISVGHSEEIRNSSTINKSSALENAETSAWGRALANLGYAGTQIASADEMKSALEQQQTSSQEPKHNEPEPKSNYTDQQNTQSTAQYKTISEGQVRFMWVKSKNKDLTPDKVAKHFGYTCAQNIPADKKIFDPILAYMDAFPIAEDKEQEDVPF